jgi:Pre ATP-grasp domain
MMTVASPAVESDRLLTSFSRLRELPAVRILVHGKTSLASSAADEAEFNAVLPGLDLDDQRALLMARRQDVVCTLDPAEDAYLDYLESVGIGPARERIVTLPAGSGDADKLGLPGRLASDPGTLRRIAELIPPDAAAVLEPYIATEAEFALARALGAACGREVAVLGGNAEIVERANRKHEVRALAQELGIPVADGEVVMLGGGGEGGRPVDTAPLKPALERHLRPTGQVILRGSRGAAGSAVRAVERTPESILAALGWAAGRPQDPTYLVEVMLPITVSPNIQMYIDEAGAHRVGASDQRLDGALLHQGNAYPSHARTIEEMLACSDALAGRLRREGYTGLVGIDFCEHEDERTGRPTAFLAEVNPRINGSTYPIVLAGLLDPDHTKIGGFVCGRIRPAARSFAELADRHGGLLLDRRTCRGTLPYNVGYLPQGCCDAVVFDRTREDALARWERAVGTFAT